MAEPPIVITFGQRVVAMKPVDRVKNLGKYVEKRFYFSKDELYDSYKRFTIQEIADKRGCSFGTVQRAMVQYGISARESRFRKNDPRLMGNNNPSFGGLSDETREKLRKGALKPERIRVSIDNLPKEISGESNSNWKGGVTFHRCEVCSKDFRANSREAKYCSMECRNRAFKEIFSLEGNPNWRGGKSFEPYPIEFNEALKKRVRERDNHECQECHQTQDELGEKLSVHHIDFNKENNDLLNLISYCRSCHSKKIKQILYITS